MSKRVGVLLSGCGFLDGAEIHESVLTMLHLDKSGAEVICMAPRGAQRDVVDHSGGDAGAGGDRDIMVEAARIARGKIRDLAEVEADDLDALILPGGFGAAKNLSDFAVEGASATPHPDVARLMKAMHDSGKPIGVACIAPAVCASVFRDSDVSPSLTIGNDADTAEALESMGAKHLDAEVASILVDDDNRIVSTPAYMYDARISEVSTGIEKMVGAVLSICEENE